MKNTNAIKGFTAVELLITLFVAAIFLAAGVQMYNLVIRDGGDTRAEAKASSVAYEYLRKYSETISRECSAQEVLPFSNIEVVDLVEVSVRVVISCPKSNVESLSKLDVTVRHDNPQKTVSYSTYVRGSGGSSIGDPSAETSGMVAQWNMNGDILDDNSRAYSYSSNLTPDTSRSGLLDGSMRFSGSNSYALIKGSEVGITNGSNGSISLWAKPTNVSLTSQQYLISSMYNNAGFAFYINGNTASNGCAINNICFTMGTVNSTTPYFTVGVAQGSNNEWKHYIATYSYTSGSSGILSLYRDGILVGTQPISGYPNHGSQTNNDLCIGSGHVCGFSSSLFRGSIDDIRIYNRALSAGQVKNIYDRGPQ